MNEFKKELEIEISTIAWLLTNLFFACQEEKEIEDAEVPKTQALSQASMSLMLGL